MNLEFITLCFLGLVIIFVYKACIELLQLNKSLKKAIQQLIDYNKKMEDNLEGCGKWVNSNENIWEEEYIKLKNAYDELDEYKKMIENTEKMSEEEYKNLKVEYEHLKVEYEHLKVEYDRMKMIYSKKKKQ